jgi:para-nitrobenzyl esterase
MAARVATHRHGLGWVLTLMVLALTGTACAGTSSTAPPATGPVVVTDAGPVSGTAAGGVDRYLGVPYAAPPVDELRWAPPVPPARWTQERVATSFGSPCPAGDSYNGPRSEIEDCLFLNVWRPTGVAPGELRPVFVFIHGGGLLNGSSAQFDGSELTRVGGVVTVSLNYRLGQFGFMAHALLTAAQGESGNYGLLDQQAALRWVQRNIAAFGGDPARVTIGGESAGAWSVCTHLVAPDSRSLFAQAVLQSGSCPSWSQAEAEKNGIGVAAALNCPTIECLRDASVAELLDAPAVGFPAPVRDTPFLPVDPDEAVRSGQFARVPVLIGANRDEGRTFAVEYRSYTADQYGAWARKVFGPHADAVLARYPWPSPSDEFSAPYQIGAVMTDSGLFGIGGCANRALTRSFAQHTATWAYEFAHRAGPGLAPTPAGYEWGAGHAAELAYLFPSFDNGTPIAPTFDADEQRLAEEMKGSWTAFTSSGDPQAAGLPDWPRYEEGGNALAWRAGRRSEVITDAQLAAGHQCDFWDSLPRQGWTVP